jgi:hypothetical protein
MAKNLKELAAKGDGVLIRVGDGWSYPGAAVDGDAIASDAEVKAALASGAFVVAMQRLDGTPVSIRPAGGKAVKALSITQAGTVEARTENHGAVPAVNARKAR